MDPLYLRKLRIDRQIQRQMQNLNNNEKNNSANAVNSGNTPAVTGEEVGNASEQMKNQANELVKNIRDEVMTPRREQKYNYIASMERSDYVKKMMNLPSTLPELLIQLQRPNNGKGIYNVLNYQVPRPDISQQPLPTQTVSQQPVTPQVPQQPVQPQVPQQPVPPQVPQQPVPPQVPQQPVQPQVPQQPQPPHIGMKPNGMRPPMHEPIPLPDSRPIPPNNNVIPPRTQYLEGNVEMWSPRPTHHGHNGHHGPQGVHNQHRPHEPHGNHGPHGPHGHNHRPNLAHQQGLNNINRPQPTPMPNSPVVNIPPNPNLPNVRPEIRPEHLHKPHIEHHQSEEVGAVKDSTIDDAQAMLYTQLSMNDIANPTLTQMKQRLTDDAFELLFTGMLNLNDLSETIKHNGKDARSKLILAMANASKQGIDNSQISGSLKMVSESIALEENNPASILKNIILLYLPWYPLQEGVGFKLAIDTMPNMSDFSSLLKVFIQTRNYGNVNGSLILMNANNVDMQIQCDDNFPKDDLLERMKEVTVNHTINSNITVEQRVQMEQDVQNQQAKVNLSSTYDLNPFLLLMAHSFIKNTIIIDGSANA